MRAKHGGALAPLCFSVLRLSQLEREGIFEGIEVKYLLSAGKTGLCVFWLALLLSWSAPVAKPFAVLLGGLVVMLVLTHLLIVFLAGGQLGWRRTAWTDRLQLLLFGAFHLLGITPASVEAKPQLTPE